MEIVNNVWSDVLGEEPKAKTLWDLLGIIQEQNHRIFLGLATGEEHPEDLLKRADIMEEAAKRLRSTLRDQL